MKQNRQIIALLGLIVFAGLIWYWNFRGPVGASYLGTMLQTYPPLGVENPALHWWKLNNVRKSDYKSAGRDPFSSIVVEPPKPQPKPGDKNYVPPPPPPPPPPPQLPASMKFFGYGTVPNGTARRAFLSDGEDVYIVGEGDVLLGRFRITHIGNASLDFEEVGSGRRGSATLEEQGSPAS